MLEKMPLTKSRKSASGKLVYRFTIFAVSITLPPPPPPNSQVGVTFGMLPKLDGLPQRVILRFNYYIRKISYLIPELSSAETAVHMGASRSILVSNNDHLRLHVCKDHSHFPRASGPNRILEADSSKAYSFCGPIGVARDCAPSRSEAAEAAKQ